MHQSNGLCQQTGNRLSLSETQNLSSTTERMGMFSKMTGRCQVGVREAGAGACRIKAQRQKTITREDDVKRVASRSRRNRQREAETVRRHRRPRKGNGWRSRRSRCTEDVGQPIRVLPNYKPYANTNVSNRGYTVSYGCSRGLSQAGFLTCRLCDGYHKLRKLRQQNHLLK